MINSDGLNLLNVTEKKLLEACLLETLPQRLTVNDSFPYFRCDFQKGLSSPYRFFTYLPKRYLWVFRLLSRLTLEQFRSSNGTGAESQIPFAFCIFDLDEKSTKMENSR